MPSIKRDATAVAAGMAETSKEPRIPVASRSGPRGCELDRLYLPYEWVLEELSCGTCADSRFVGEPHHCLQWAKRVAEVVVLFQNVVVKKAYRGEGMEAYYEAAAAQKRRRSVGGAAPVPSELKGDAEDVVCECSIVEVGPLEVGDGKDQDRFTLGAPKGGEEWCGQRDVQKDGATKSPRLQLIRRWR